MPTTIEGTGPYDAYRFAIVVSMYHDFVTERLLAGTLAALTEAGVPDDGIVVIKVPGAFEIPAVARQAAGTGRYHAIVTLGCLIRGATPHFDFIASAVAHGLTDAAGQTGVPIAFGVLTTNSIEEALERAGDGLANKGREAARAAVEMAAVADRLARGAP